jgi:hypothetical protein
MGNHFIISSANTAKRIIKLSILTTVEFVRIKKIDIRNRYFIMRMHRIFLLNDPPTYYFEIIQFNA